MVYQRHSAFATASDAFVTDAGTGMPSQNHACTAGFQGRGLRALSYLGGSVPAGVEFLQRSLWLHLLRYYAHDASAALWHYT